MAIYKIAIIVFISIGITLGNPQKISIGGFKTSGITKNEINKLKTEIDKKILTTNGFSLINHNNIYSRFNQDTLNILECVKSACMHEIAHEFNLNAVIAGEITFHENGVNIMVRIFSHWHEKIIDEINEEHAPIRFSAVVDLISNNYIPELLTKYSKLVKPNLKIVEPAKFLSISESEKLNILLNMSDNKGLESYFIEYSENGGNKYVKVKSGNFNNELEINGFPVNIPIIGGITDKAMIRVTLTDNDQNINSVKSNLFSVTDNTPPIVNIKNPKRSEIIMGSNDYNIVWTSEDNLGIYSHEILFSTDEGKTYYTIATLNGTYSNFNWSVPDLLTNNCYIKIITTDLTQLKSEDYVGPISVMDGQKPSLTIIDKVSGRSFPEHTEFNSKLNLRDNTGVKLVEAYFTKNKVNFELLSETVFEDLIKNEDIAFKFKLPGGVTSNAQIKWVVRDLFENETTLFSDKFDITDNTPPKNKIIYPVKGVIFKGSEQGKIIWTSSDNTTVASHEIYYSLNNGKSWNFIGKSGGDKNNIIWNIPDVFNTTTKLKLITNDIIGLSNETISDIFVIEDVIEPTINLVKPNDLFSYKERDTIKIHLNLKDNIGLKSAQVYLKIESQSISLFDENFEKGTKNKDIFISRQLTALPKDNIEIIASVKDEANNMSQFNSGSFNLIDNTPPNISFYNDFENLKINGNSKFRLNWLAKDNVGIKETNIYFTYDNGKSWNNIFTTKSEITEFLWSVPNIHSETCMLKISVSDLNDFQTEIISSNFSILDKLGPELIILKPEKNEIYKEHEIIDISVIAKDDYGLGIIELYYSQNGNDFDYIANQTFTSNILKDTASFTFKIREGLSEKSLFKFIGLDRFNNETNVKSEVFSVEDNTPPNVEFSISLPSNELGTGKSYIIDWIGSDNYLLKSTTLEFSSDNGKNWIELYNKSLKSTKTENKYTWLVPSDLKSPCILKVSLTDVMNLTSEAVYSNFKIVDQTNPEIKITSEQLKSVKENKYYNLSVQLFDNHNLNSLDFYYSKNSVDYNYINSISDIKGKNQDISHSIKIPEGTAKSAFIKMVLLDMANNSTTLHTNPFEVIDFTKPSVKMISEIPTITKNKQTIDITWFATDNEALNSNLIELSHNSGINWMTLTKLPGSVTNWKWSVPDTITNNTSMIRIVTTDHVSLTDTSYSNIFSIEDKINPEIFIPYSKYHIEVKERDTLYQSIDINDNVQLKHLKIDYSNVPNQFNSVDLIAFQDNYIKSKSLKLKIPIPAGATKNAKIKFTLEDIAGNISQKVIKGIRVIDNTAPFVKLVEPFESNDLLNKPIFIVGDTLWFYWESSDNTGIRSNKISYKNSTSDYWQPILTARGDKSSLSWVIPEKAIGVVKFQIITTDLIGLQSDHTIGPFEIKDILDNSRNDLVMKYGSLAVESNPSGAMVMIDNIERGYTPIILKNISEGNHRLMVYKRQFKHISKIIQIESDSILTVNEVLERK